MIRIGLIGCGNIQRKHVRTFSRRTDECQVVALMDVSPEVCQVFAEKTELTGSGPEPMIFTDLVTMYEQAKLDAVSICTPHTLHFEQAMQALDAGCHVLMEKPMVTNAEHAYTLHDKVQSGDRVFLVAYNTSCKPEMAYIRDVIRNQELGKLEVISGFISQGWRDGTIGLWRQDPALSGGGMAYDSGAHPLNTLCWTVEARVAEVFAIIDNVDTPVDINSVIAIRFENGVMASFSVGGNCPTNGAAMSYIFTAGRIDVDPWGASRIEVFRGNDRIKYLPISNDFATPADNFLDAIAGKAEPAATTYNGIVHTELMDAIYESAQAGKVARPKRKSSS